MLSFPLVMAAAHVLVLVACAWILVRWHCRLERAASRTPSLPRKAAGGTNTPSPRAASGPWWLWLFQILSDGVVFAFASLAGAGMLVVTDQKPFALVRLAAQLLFGELPVLLVLIGLLHMRAAGGSDGRTDRYRAGVLLAVAALILGVYVQAYHREPYDLQVRRHTLDFTQGRPPAGTLRLLHLTDLQTHAIRDYERRALRMASALRPDLIVFTGDYVQSRYRPTHEQAATDLRELLQAEPLQAPYGVYAVEGDVEHDGWTTLFTGTNVRCLSDETVSLSLPGGRTVALVGLDVRTSREPNGKVLEDLLGRANASDYRIALGHAPEYVQHLPRSPRLHLALAGHTHGGQVVIPGFGPPITFSRLPRKYAGGLHRFGDTSLHVSRGIGMERNLAPQVRFLCPPEICLLEIRY